MAEKAVVKFVHGIDVDAQDNTTLNATILVTDGNNGCSTHTIEVSSGNALELTNWRLKIRDEVIRFCADELSRTVYIVIFPDLTTL